MYILLMHFFSDQYLVGLIFLGGCHLMYPKVTLRLTNMLEDFIYGQKVRFCPPEITSKIYLMKYFSVEFHSCAHFNSIYVCPKHMWHAVTFQILNVDPWDMLKNSCFHV